MTEESIFLENNSAAIFIQWACDIHEDCQQVAEDPGFCPAGCTFMMVNSKTELKWQIEDKDNAYTCDCDNDCKHTIKPSDFKNLQDGLMVNALWPFDGNYYYPARVVHLQPVYSFPSKSERQKMAQIYRDKDGKIIKKGALGEGVYCAWDDKNCECLINRQADQKSTQFIGNDKSPARKQELLELARLNNKIKWLQNEINKKKKELNK